MPEVNQPSMSEMFMNALQKLYSGGRNFISGLDDKINDPALLNGLTGPTGKVQLQNQAIDPAIVANQLMGQPQRPSYPISGNYENQIYNAKVPPIAERIKRTNVLNKWAID